MKHAVKRIHFVGIGGVGMSGIAEVLLNLGYAVSGSDLADNVVTQRLSRLGAQIHRGHSVQHIADTDVVVTRPPCGMTIPKWSRRARRRFPSCRAH